MVRAQANEKTICHKRQLSGSKKRLPSKYLNEMGDFNHHKLKFLDMGVAVVDFEFEAIAFFRFISFSHRLSKTENAPKRFFVSSR